MVRKKETLTSSSDKPENEDVKESDLSDIESSINSEKEDAEEKSTAKPVGKSEKAKRDLEKTKKVEKTKRKRNLNPITWVITFLRQVYSELRKVVWINRRETYVYTVVVLIFVIVLIGYIAILDYGFVKLMDLIFG